MSYRESRAKWRKAWRHEPVQRRSALSLHARALLGLLRDFAADDGCLGPVAEGGRPGSLIAQSMGVRSQDRKGFHRDFEELLKYGDDGEPLGLVIRDGHFWLTGFEQTQARQRDRTRTTHGQRTDNARTTERANPPKTRNTETATPTEDRRKSYGDRVAKTDHRLAGRRPERLATREGLKAGVDSVAAHWLGSGLAVDDAPLGKPDLALIRARLREGWSVDACLGAIDELAVSKWHRETGNQQLRQALDGGGTSQRLRRNAERAAEAAAERDADLAELTPWPGAQRGQA